MCDNGFGESGRKGSPVQSKVIHISTSSNTPANSLLLCCIYGKEKANSQTHCSIIWLTDSIILFWRRNAPTKGLHDLWNNILCQSIRGFLVDNLKVQKNHDVMMNGNDFHGSVAFGAQLYLGHAIWMKVDEKMLKLVTYIMDKWLVG